MKVIIGIDVGGSTTKIVGIRHDGEQRSLITPQLVKANDPVTSAYGAFGKFTNENEIAISDISRVVMTGVGSSYVKGRLYGIDCRRVPEFDCIGKGGIYLSGLDRAVVVSMGTGTAIVNATKNGEMEYLGGTGVGGGTLLGLSKLLIGAEDVDTIAALAADGDVSNIDLKIKDMTAGKHVLNADMTAANFGNLSEIASKGDVAAGILNLIYETVGMVSIFASRSRGVKDIVLTGNLTKLDSCEKKFDEFNHLGYGVNFTIPKMSEFSTVIGCALSAFD